jgi:hypothetical protein
MTAGQGRFSACIELRNGRSLAVSFFQVRAQRTSPLTVNDLNLVCYNLMI